MGPPQPRGFVHCEEEAQVSLSMKLLRSVKIPGLAVIRPVWMALQIQLCPILLKCKELAADLQGLTKRDSASHTTSQLKIWNINVRYRTHAVVNSTGKYWHIMTNDNCIHLNCKESKPKLGIKMWKTGTRNMNKNMIVSGVLLTVGFHEKVKNKKD